MHQQYSSNYNGGAERVWTQDLVGFGGKGITAGTGGNAGTIQAQASNGVIYNTSALPGKIKSITLTQAGTARQSSCYCGSTGRLVNDVTANYTVSGTQVGAASTTGWTATDFGANDYRYFAIKRGSNVAYFSSIVIEYELSNDPQIVASPGSLNFGQIDVGQPNSTEQIDVTGMNLTGDITAVLGGADASQFSINKATLPSTGGSIQVTYTPSAAAAVHTAVLTLSSSGATDVTVNLTGETVEPIVTTGNGTLANPYTVADVKLLNNSLGTVDKYWVKGYIIGTPSGGNGTDLTNVTLDAPFTSASSIALSDLAFERDLSKMIAVQLVNGTNPRTALNLVDNEVLLNVPVLVHGTLEGYFSGTPGVKNTDDYRVLKSVFKTDGNWSVGTNWYAGVAPASTDDVIIKAAATLDGDVTVNNLTIASGATLLTDTYTLTITSGTATVEQLVNKPQTYYIGSPVGGTVTTTNIGDAITFTESNNQWSSPVAFANPVVGKGYGVQVGKNESPGTTTISFTGTELNSGNKNVTLTIGDRKFNFLGNPYPSYLDGAEVVASANLEKTIWMYHKTGVDGGGKSVYQFKFYNVSGAGTGTLSDKYIPTMQGFWVRVAPEVTSNFTYTFINGMRTYKGTSTTVFLAPQVSEKQELRLALSNGTVSDEAILLFSENANNDWNSSKMMNPGLNIYTVKGSESLALNSRTAIEYDVETAVGVKAESGVYTFSASKFENFGAEKAYLLDKVANVATDLSSGDYTVNFAEAYDGTDRFALVFPRSGVVTGLENAEAAGFFAFANNNRISVNSDAQTGMIYVFNSVGQQVATQAISGKLTTVSTALPAGVYMVKVNNLTTKVVVR